MILIVDDDAAMGASLERLLRVLGYNAVAIPNAMEALSLLTVRPPQLIILDMHLPGVMNGLMFIRAVRADPAFAKVPIWIYSVDFSDSVMRDAKAAGAQEYLVKGAIGYSALAQRVESLLGKPRD
jgi:two-component system, chemotaxis family, chemotaxis protein CheY